MRDSIVIMIALVGTPLLAWLTVHGLKTGVMDAAGVPYASYERAKHPIMFWLATALNSMAIIVGTAMLIEASLQGI